MNPTRQSHGKHKSSLAKVTDYDKPWKVKRLIGKYIRCALCSGKEQEKIYRDKLRNKNKREEKLRYLSEME